MSDQIELPDGQFVPIQDTICECNHWYEEHDGTACGAPFCPCLGFVADPQASTAESIAARGGDPKRWPAHVSRRTVYVPTPGSPLRAVIAAGSGIIGFPRGGRVQIDYEGNLYGAGNLVTFEQRVLHAWDRQVAEYPTVARSLVEATELVAVGTFDPIAGLTVTDAEAVAQWVRREGC